MHTYRITLRRQVGAKRAPQAVVLQAEWFKIEEGALIFRISQRATFPLAVRCFAHSTWNGVEMICEEKQKA